MHRFEGKHIDADKSNLITADAPDYGIRVPVEEKLLEWLAVLCVEGITYHLVRDQAGWIIRVPSAKDSPARQAIAEHERSHQGWPTALESVEQLTPGVFAGAWAGFWGAYLVGLFYLWLGPYRSTDALFQAAGARRSAIRAGEWWRTVTALMVHADIGHLVSNMVFLFVFAALVCRKLGLGLGWFLILSAGVAGNAMVALTTAHDAVGIGASTACFGALGLLVALGLRQERLQKCRPLNGRFRSWMPLGGGLAMLSLTGSAPGSDVIAHLFGFLAGIILGLPGWIWHGQLSGRIQKSILAMTIVCLGLSWWLACRSAACLP